MDAGVSVPGQLKKKKQQQKKLLAGPCMLSRPGGCRDAWERLRGAAATPHRSDGSHGRTVARDARGRPEVSTRGAQCGCEQRSRARARVPVRRRESDADERRPRVPRTTTAATPHARLSNCLGPITGTRPSMTACIPPTHAPSPPIMLAVLSSRPRHVLRMIAGLFSPVSGGPPKSCLSSPVPARWPALGRRAYTCMCAVCVYCMCG